MNTSNQHQAGFLSCKGTFLSLADAKPTVTVLVATVACFYTILLSLLPTCALCTGLQFDPLASRVGRSLRECSGCSIHLPPRAARAFSRPHKSLTARFARSHGIFCFLGESPCGIYGNSENLSVSIEIKNRSLDEVGGRLLGGSAL